MQKLIPLGLVAALLGGCASLVPRLEAPNLSIVNVQLGESTMWQQNLKVRMRVQNPNPRALPIRGLSYALDVAGEELAQGVSDNSFTVPALGETEFDMTLRTNMAAMLLRLAGGNKALSRDRIDYRIRGKVSLSEGLLRSIPFEQSGTFKLN